MVTIIFFSFFGPTSAWCSEFWEKVDTSWQGCSCPWTFQRATSLPVEAFAWNVQEQPCLFVLIFLKLYTFERLCLVCWKKKNQDHDFFTDIVQYLSECKGPSQKVHRSPVKRTKFVWEVGVFEKIALWASYGVLYTLWSQSWSLIMKCELLFVSGGGGGGGGSSETNNFVRFTGLLRTFAMAPNMAPCFIACTVCLGKHEEYRDCGTMCQPTCANPRPMCNKMCARGCFCTDDYIRDAENGFCISQLSCPHNGEPTR